MEKQRIKKYYDWEVCWIIYFVKIKYKKIYTNINPLASPSAGAPALKYGDVNIVTPSPVEVKGLIKTKNGRMLHNI